MAGHGHVVPNKDGSLARCGGPKLCSVCAMEFAQVHYTPSKDRDTGERADCRNYAVVNGEGWAEAAFDGYHPYQRQNLA